MKRPFTRAGFALVLTGLMTLSLAAAGGVNADRDNPDNPTCDGYEYSYKLESPGSGPYTVARDGLTATFTVGTHADVASPNQNNAVTSFDANRSSGVVIVKGGNGAITYGFDAATPMHAPAVASGKWPTISHVQLCWNSPDEPDLPGRIEVTKQVLGNGAPAETQFRIALTGPGSGGETSHRMVAAGETAVFDDLEPGRYQVTEVEVPDGFDVETDVPVEVDVGAGNTYQVQIRNRFRHQTGQEGSVEVTKVVIGAGAPTEAEFTIVLTGPSPDGTQHYDTVLAGETAVFDGLEPGTYTVSESDMPDGFVAIGLPVEVEVTAHETVTLDVVNQHEQQAPPDPGTLEVTKEVTGDDAPTDAEFTFCLTGPGAEGAETCETVMADQTATFDGLEPGEYVLTEQSLPTGFTLFTELPLVITVGDGQTVAKTVINDYTASSPPSPDLGTVEVTKLVTGTDAPDADFEICLTGPGSDGTVRCETVQAGETAVFDDLEPGTYAVTETDVPDDFEVVTTLPMAIDAVAGRTATATVTNEYVAQESLPPAVDDDTGDVADDTDEVETDFVAESGAVQTAPLPTTGSGTALTLIATILILSGVALMLLGSRPRSETV